MAKGIYGASALERYTCSYDSLACNRRADPYGVWDLRARTAKPCAFELPDYGSMVMWFCTFMVPGADHAASSASCLSAQERTLP